MHNVTLIYIQTCKCHAVCCCVVAVSLTARVLCCYVLFASTLIVEVGNPKLPLCTCELVLAAVGGLDALFSSDTVYCLCCWSSKFCSWSGWAACKVSLLWQFLLQVLGRWQERICIRCRDPTVLNMICMPYEWFNDWSYRRQTHTCTASSNHYQLYISVTQGIIICNRGGLNFLSHHIYSKCTKYEEDHCMGSKHCPSVKVLWSCVYSCCVITGPCRRYTTQQ